MHIYAIIGIVLAGIGIVVLAVNNANDFGTSDFLYFSAVKASL